MITEAIVEALPLGKDAYGVYRVGGTRVVLDLVISAYHHGKTPEQIADSYSAIQISDVYYAIAYYLTHKSELDEYFARRKREQDELLTAHPEWKPVGLKERLLARQKAV